MVLGGYPRCPDSHDLRDRSKSSTILRNGKSSRPLDTFHHLQGYAHSSKILTIQQGDPVKGGAPENRKTPP